MTATPLKYTAFAQRGQSPFALDADSWAITSSIPTSKPHNDRLVARWLIDENSKLYCQWARED